MILSRRILLLQLNHVVLLDAIHSHLLIALGWLRVYLRRCLGRWLVLNLIFRLLLSRNRVTLTNIPVNLVILIVSKVKVLRCYV